MASIVLAPSSSDDVPEVQPAPVIGLDDLEHEEQFLIWILRNWLTRSNRWAHMCSAIRGYLGDVDSQDAMRAFGDIILCLKYNGRRKFSAGAPGCPITPDEMALMTLIGARQNEDRQLSEGLVTWLARPPAQQVLAASAAKFAMLLQMHGLVLPLRQGAPTVAALQTTDRPVLRQQSGLENPA